MTENNPRIQRWVVEPAADGLRLDVAVARRWPDHSRAVLQQAILAGRVRLDGAVVKPSRRVAAGQAIDLDLPDPAAPAAALQPVTLTFPVVFVDDHVVVIDKPPGLVTHPGAGREATSVVAAVLSAYSLSPVGAPVRPGVVHRLDQGTSGLMVLARTTAAHHALVRAFAQRKVDKEYLALVRGHPPERGRIEVAIERDRQHRQRMAATRPDKGRMAVSQFQRIEQYADAALVRVKAITGRTHQIRVHFAWLGHPLVGDRLYGGPRWPTVERFRLHCTRLAFPHPLDGRQIGFEAPPPADFTAALVAAAARIGG